MKLSIFLPFITLGLGLTNAASPRADALIYAMSLVDESNQFIVSGIRGWNGKFMTFNPVRFEMHMLRRLMTDAVHKASTSGDLIPEDFAEVLESATGMAAAVDDTMNITIANKNRLRKADLTFYVRDQLEKQEKTAAAFAKSMLNISPTFGKEVDEVLGKTIAEVYQRAIEALR